MTRMQNFLRHIPRGYQLEEWQTKMVNDAMTPFENLLDEAEIEAAKVAAKYEKEAEQE